MIAALSARKISFVLFFVSFVPSWFKALTSNP
jgi:hypothetical protein